MRRMDGGFREPNGRTGSIDDRWISKWPAFFVYAHLERERDESERERGTRSRTHTESENAVDRTRSEIVVIETRMLLAGTNGR